MFFAHLLSGVLRDRSFSRGKRRTPKRRPIARTRPWVEVLEDRTLMTVVQWSGLGADNLWNNGSNWVGGSVPMPMDSVLFDATSSVSVTLDVDPTVINFSVTADYTGTINLDSHTLHLTGDLTRAGGTLSAASAMIQLQGTAAQSVDFGLAATLGQVEVNNSMGIVTFAQGFTADTLAVSPGDTVHFLATQKFNVTNHLSLQGTTASPITLDSTEPWTAWGLNVASGGTQTIMFVHVKQSDASSGALIHGTSLTDLGFNTNWDFGATPTLTAVTASSMELAKVYVRFSEAMDAPSATTIGNYMLSGGLTVTDATISSDKKLVTLTASGNVTPGTTTLTASTMIKSLVQHNLALTTPQTIVAGNLYGIPATALQVQLALSSDDNQSVIWDAAGTFSLTITVTGTMAATPVGIGEIREPGGTSVAYLGAAGTATSATETTSGGTTNTATIMVHGAVRGFFKNDFTLRAYVDNQDRVAKPATVVGLILPSNANPYYADQRPLHQTLAIMPAFAGVQFVGAATVSAVAPTGETITNPTQFLGPLPFPATDAAGQSMRTLFPPNASASISDAFGLRDASSSASPFGPQPTLPPTQPLCGTSASGASAGAGSGDGGDGCGCGCNSIDPSNGEKTLHITDFTIQGRGLDYQFSRVYRDFNYRASSQAPLTDFGENWSFSYADDRLVMDGSNPATALYIHYPDSGGQLGDVFLNTGTANDWISGTPTLFVGLRKLPGAGDMEIRDQSGLVHVYYSFTDPTVPQGRLKEIRDRNGNSMTFHYELINPSGTGPSKYVLAYVIDTMGREIRYLYYAATSQTIMGRTVTVVSSQPSWGRLAHVIDFKGDMDFSGHNQQQDFPGQVNNRTLTFDYDEEGNLVRYSAPAVGGTPNGNNFTTGETYRYQYVTNANRGGLMQSDWDHIVQLHQQNVLLHKLTDIWYPNEVQNAPTVNPPVTQAAETIGYDTNPASEFFGFATSWTVGATNGNGVAAGGTTMYSYTDMHPGRNLSGGGQLESIATQTLRVDIFDRDGNHTQNIYGGFRNLLTSQLFTGGMRPGDPLRPGDPTTSYTQMFTQNQDVLPTMQTSPQGNTLQSSYNENSHDRMQQGNLIRTIQTPDVPRGGDQTPIETVYGYDPIYNQRCLTVDARGANMGANGFTPPIADPAMRTMVDPHDPTKTLNMRYVTIEFYDYQQSTEKASMAPIDRLSMDGSGMSVRDSDLARLAPNALTTEVWLVQILGLPQTLDGLTTLRRRLMDANTMLGLGSLDGSGDNTPKVAGNIVRTVHGSPVLVAGSNQQAIEVHVKSLGGLVNEMLGYGLGGTSEGTHGDRLQTVVTMYQYNKFGQLTKTISPEGNVTLNQYYPENDPDGEIDPAPPTPQKPTPAHRRPQTPTPADGRSLDTMTGGYLAHTVTDAMRSYVDKTGTLLTTAPFSDSGTNPAATNLTVSYLHDNVGNIIRMTDGRGIRTDYFVNERNEVVQTTRAADISAVSTTDPLLTNPDPNVRLTAFGYLTRSFFDYNGNVVLSQIEDRGNTSNVDGNGLGTIPNQAVGTTPGLDATNGGDPPGGPAFADTLHLYDILNDVIETDVEVDNAHALKTRYRYDSNQHLVFTIYPEGNADSAIYDERDLLFQSTTGASGPALPPTDPRSPRFAPTDPTTFNRPGGAGTEPSTTTRNYDLNRNLIEIVNAQNNGGARSMIAGAGDVTAFTYDGFDRRKSVIDPNGNMTIYTYDPVGNVVREVQVGAVLNDTPSADHTATLKVTEYIYDELSRVVATHQVLFLTPYGAQGPQRTPTLSDNAAMAALAPFLADAASDTARVPGHVGDNITVLGRITTLTDYDRDGRPTFTVQDDLHTGRTEYDGAGRVIKTTDSALNNGFNFSLGVFNPTMLAGNTVEFAYDADSNRIEQKETDVTTVANVAAEIFHTTSLYDSLNRLQTTVDNLGQTHDFRYDSRDNLVATADAVGPLGSSPIFRYDARGHLVATPMGPVGPRTIDRRGLGSTATIIVNGFGNVTRTRYDGLGRKLETETMLTPSGQGDGAYIGATLEGVLEVPPTGYLDPAQAGDGLISTYYAWDGNSQMLALRDDNGNTTAYIYDNEGRTLVERKGLYLTGAAFSIEGGGSGTFNVALRGGVPPSLLASGTSTGGNTPTQLKDSTQTWTTNQWAGKTLFISGGTGAGQVRKIFANNATTLMLTAAWTTIPDNTSTYAIAVGSPTDIGYDYDKDGNRIQTLDEAGNVFACTYDALMRKTGCTITLVTSFTGTTRLTSQYDGLSRLTVSFDNNTSAATAVTDKFFYDSLSRTVEESEQIGNLAAQPTSSSFNVNLSNSVGQPSAVIYPDTRQVDSTYDNLDRLVTRLDHGQPNIGTYQYIGPTRVAVLTYENGTRLTYIGQAAGQNADIGYDGMRRVVNMRWEAFTPTTPLGQGTLIVGFGYQDAAGNPAYDRANDKLIEEKLHDPGNSEVYTYDSAYRLTSFARGTLNAAKTAIATPTNTLGALQNQGWTVDGLGNWTANTHTTGGTTGTENRTAGSFNQITTLTGSPYDGNATGTYVYDNNGNLTDDGVRTYQYDAMNRLRNVFRKSDNLQVAAYTYDSGNRRVRTVVTNGGIDGTLPNGTTDFYYQGWQVVEEHDGTNAITQQYVYGSGLDQVWTLDNRRNGITVAQLNAATGEFRHFYHTNTLGSVYGLTNQSGVLKEGYQYDAYGRQTVFTPGVSGVVHFGDGDVITVGGHSALSNNYLYTGQRFDAETGLDYYKSRYDSPELGRFISRDPIEYGGGDINLYAYVHDNPSNSADPVGMQEIMPPALEPFLYPRIIPPTPRPLPPSFTPGRLHPPFPPLFPNPTNPDARRKWYCTSKCQGIQIDPKCICPPWLYGSGYGPSEEIACREAKRAAGQSAPRGCYGRHCDCRCEQSNGWDV
jgi:RHS repeat-associated protein